MEGVGRYGNGQLSVAGMTRWPCHKLAQFETDRPGVTVRTPTVRARPALLCSRHGVWWYTSMSSLAYLFSTNGAYQLYMANVPPGARRFRASASEFSVSR